MESSSDGGYGLTQALLLGRYRRARRNSLAASLLAGLAVGVHRIKGERELPGFGPEKIIVFSQKGETCAERRNIRRQRKCQWVLQDLATSTFGLNLGSYTASIHPLRLHHPRHGQL